MPAWCFAPSRRNPTPALSPRLGRETDRETREFVLDVAASLPVNWTIGQRAEVFINVAQETGAVVLPLGYLFSRLDTRGAWRLARRPRLLEPLEAGLARPRCGASPGRSRAGRLRAPPGRSRGDARRRGTGIAAMNLAIRDLRRSLGRFLLTTAGLSLLVMIIMGMGGIYRGLVADALVLLNHTDADLWVVQRDTRGPLAEPSHVPRSLVPACAPFPPSSGPGSSSISPCSASWAAATCVSISWG